MGDWERTFGERGMAEGFMGGFNTNPQLEKREVTLFFETAEESRQWAKKHPGEPVVRNPTGPGFIANLIEWYNQHTGDSYLDCEKDKYLAYRRELELRKNAVNFADQCISGHPRAGKWLFENGYKDLLIQLHEEYLAGIQSISTLKKIKTSSFDEVPRDSPLRTVPEYNPYKVQSELKPRLRSLLPVPFPENYYPKLSYN